MDTYAYLIFSLFLLGVWLIVFFSARSGSRPEIRRVSFWTMWLALTEPFFVPAYWNPPTLFDLARRAGFDLESFIFCFAVGGIVVVMYEALLPARHVKMPAGEHRRGRHRFHFWAVVSAPIAFLLLLAATSFNPIYAAMIALVAGFFATWYCRPDLVSKMLVSGALFTGVYFVTFLLLNFTFPGYVQAVWNFAAISGVLISGVPLEELLWAFSFGLYWSSVYEHFSWYRLKKVLNEKLNARV
ncbi:MAG: lycopene cyclase domain-containing protein [Patescibacteria group bacterium]